MEANAISQQKAARLPLCLFVLKKSPQHKNLVEKQFSEEGLRTHFLVGDQVPTKLEATLSELQQECYAVFFDAEYFSVIEKITTKDVAPWPFFVALAKGLSSHQNSKFINAGVSDVLPLPVHPVTFKSRSRMLLARWALTYAIPEDLQLPAGIVRQGAASKAPKSAKTKRKYKKSKSELASAPHKDTFGNRKWTEEQLNFFQQVYPLLQPHEELFFAEKNESSKTRSFAEAAHEGVSCMIWTRGLNQRQKCRVKQFVEATRSIELCYPKNQRGDLFKAQLQGHLSGEVFLNIRLQRASLFMVQLIDNIQWQEEGWIVAMPKELFEVQRRADFRFSPKPRFPIILTTSLSESPLSLKDISSGGCCVALPLEVFRRLKVGERVEKMAFTIYGEKIECAARVCWKRAGNEEDSRNLVGLRFEDLSLYHREGIQIFVFEESARYLKKHFAKD